VEKFVTIFLSEEQINELYYREEHEEKRDDEFIATTGDKLYCLKLINARGIEIFNAGNEMLLIQKETGAKETQIIESYRQLKILKRKIDNHCQIIEEAVARENLGPWLQSIAGLLEVIFFGLTNDFETNDLKKYSEHIPPIMYYFDKHQAVYSKAYKLAYDVKEEEISFGLVKAGITGAFIAGISTMIGFCLPLSLPATTIMVIVSSILLILCPLAAIYIRYSSIVAKAEAKFEAAVEKKREQLNIFIRIELDHFLMQSLFEANLLGLKAQILFDNFYSENPLLKQHDEIRHMMHPPGGISFIPDEEEFEEYKFDDDKIVATYSF
jgi:hypothetical protein